MKEWDYSKINVGDKIKIVEVTHHHDPEIKVGDVQTIVRKGNAESFITNTNNCFHKMRKEEFEIIKEEENE